MSSNSHGGEVPVRVLQNHHAVVVDDFEYPSTHTVITAPVDQHVKVRESIGIPLNAPYNVGASAGRELDTLVYEGYDADMLKLYDVNTWTALADYGNGTAVFMPAELERMRTNMPVHCFTARSKWEGSRDEMRRPVLAEDKNLQACVVLYLHSVCGVVPCVPCPLRRHTLIFELTAEQVEAVRNAPSSEFFDLLDARTNECLHRSRGSGVQRSETDDPTEPAL